MKKVSKAVYEKWIDENKSLKRMLRNLRQSRTDSKSTKYRYVRDLHQFCEYHNVVPDELLEKWNEVKYADSYGSVRRIIDEYTEMLREWADYLEEQKYARSAISSKVAGVRTFFRENDLDLKSFNVRPESIYEDMPITIQQYADIVNYVSTTQAKAFYKFEEDSGLRPDTIRQLRLHELQDVVEFLEDKGSMNDELKEMLKPHGEIMVVFVDRAKTKRKQFGYFSFIGEETVAYLQQYWKERELRGEEITDDSLVFAHKTDPNVSSNIPNLMTCMFNRTLKKLGYKPKETKDGKIERLRMYVGRKLFSSMCISSGVPREWRHFFMGQKNKLGIDYNYLLDYVPEGLKQWLKAYPKLMLTNAENIERVLSLEEQMQKLKQENVSMKSEMEKIRQFGAIMFSEVQKHEELLNAVNLEAMKITGNSISPMVFSINKKKREAIYIRELS